MMNGNPSFYLEGQILNGGWTVGSQIKVGKNTTAGTGGHFSVAYDVIDKNGNPAFLKAIDYSTAMNHPARTVILEQITKAYNFECDVLEKCGAKNLDRVVKFLAKGSVMINRSEASGPVEYIIFEKAKIDARKHLSISGNFDLAWKLRALQHIATGLKQIHSCGIAHQDLKPSNVLVFDGKPSKIADFGRAASQNHSSIFDNDVIAGDRGYAPPDLAYGFVLPDWNMKRLSCDAYHLGSMVVYFFTGSSMTQLLFKHLDISLRPQSMRGSWTGSFEEVLPSLTVAFGDSLNEFASSIAEPSLRKKLVEIVRQLCEPDVRRRGHPKSRSKDGNSFSLERYIGEFNLLAHRAEAGFFKEVIT